MGRKILLAGLIVVSVCGVLPRPNSFARSAMSPTTPPRQRVPGPSRCQHTPPRLWRRSEMTRHTPRLWCTRRLEQACATK